MNLSAIKSACYGGKYAKIYNYMNIQWISNGFAAYRVRGVEINSDTAMMELWNLSDSARRKASILKEYTTDPRLRPVVEDEEELTLLGAVGLAETGHYVGLESVHGVLWIDTEWLKPLKLDYARYFARWDHGRPLIAVYEDLEGAEALILPVSNQVGDQIMVAAARLSGRSFHWPDDEEAAEAEERAEALFRDDVDGGA